MRVLILGVAFALFAAGCGQRGALYLRDDPPAGVKPERTDRYKPVPYPRQSSEQK